ncbi:MAG: acetyl-CoA carboxylase biotin carboxyl carrier protein subunit [Armatimonadetes bacterium]|nr:acetyl-CoA carboxylase biotin carboxyl carrier protein subunit [Armatimonadota bacterium]
MRYRVQVDGAWHDVDVLGREGAAWRVRVDGRERVLEQRGGHLTVDESAVRWQVRADAQGDPLGVQVWGLGAQGQEFSVRVEGLRRSGRARLASAAGTAGKVTAPMNGTVVKVLHAAGDAVGNGDVILVLEAMKMENEVASPLDGRLKAVAATTGATVKPGDLLFEVERVD